MEERPVKCFQHCRRSVNIFCFTVPLVCPLCGQDVLRTESRIPPYIINSPFVVAMDTVCSIVIKPTVGSFLRDFTNSSNLHVGLTDSKGTVYEYDEDGVTVSRGSVSWQQCLEVKLLTDFDLMSLDWDTKLLQFAKGAVWRKERYDENLHNCFDFVIGFLRHLGLQSRVPSLTDRHQFCSQILIPRTHKAGQFISVYRDIVRQGYSCQPTGAAGTYR